MNGENGENGDKPKTAWFWIKRTLYSALGLVLAGFISWVALTFWNMNNAVVENTKATEMLNKTIEEKQAQDQAQWNSLRRISEERDDKLARLDAVMIIQQEVVLPFIATIAAESFLMAEEDRPRRKMSTPPSLDETLEKLGKVREREPVTAEEYEKQEVQRYEMEQRALPKSAK